MPQAGRVCSCNFMVFFAHWPYSYLWCGLGTMHYNIKHSKTYSQLITASRELDARSRITTDKFQDISGKYYMFLLSLLLCISLMLLYKLKCQLIFRFLLWHKFRCKDKLQKTRHTRKNTSKRQIINIQVPMPLTIYSPSSLKVKSCARFPYTEK